MEEEINWVEVLNNAYELEKILEERVDGGNINE